MLSDEAITDVIKEFDEALELMDKQSFVPGFRSILADVQEALKQLTTPSVPSDNSGEEFILTHLVTDGTPETLCCNKSLWDLPTDQRVTLDPKLSNCGKPKDNG